jgi:hypothetical protein
MTRPNVMAVKTALVKQVLVAQIADAAQRRIGTVSLAEGFDPEDRGEGQLALARAGYATRIAERGLLEPAQRSTPGLEEDVLENEARLGDRRAAIVHVSRELAAAEPPGRSDPEEGVASWRVPGPGGHVRHYVALELGRRLAGSGDDPARKRNFMFGFFVRCCEEAVAGRPPGPENPRI